MEITRVEVVALGLLAEEPLYGYQLLERFRGRAMDHWAQVGRASVYQALHRLEREGHVTGRDQGRGEGPERRVYRITRPGRDRLRQGLLERLSEEAPRAEAAVALGFGHVLRTDDLKRGIVSRLASLDRSSEVLASERSRLKSASGPANQLARRALDLQAALVRTERTWLASLRREAGRLAR